VHLNNTKFWEKVGGALLYDWPYILLVALTMGVMITASLPLWLRPPGAEMAHHDSSAAVGEANGVAGEARGGEIPAPVSRVTVVIRELAARIDHSP
jgi:hypothetical protein